MNPTRLFSIIASLGLLLPCSALHTLSEPMTKENTFIKATPNLSTPPTLQQVKSQIPVPQWPARPEAISSYWKAWEIAFSNLHSIDKGSGFIEPYIDAGLINGNIFMWDTAFVAMYGKYASGAFSFQASLDNFYAKQHSDGFICREISPKDGSDDFEKYNPSSTGPNIMAWAEWDYYQFTNDRERLQRVFPPLVAYYRWLRTNRSWQDGSYFLSGWGCGMDNQPRLPKGKGYHVAYSHGFMSWIDATLQQIMSGRILLNMAKELGRETDLADIQEEVDYLTQFVNDKMWNEKTHFYSDKFRDGTISQVQTIGAYWALLAGVVPQERMNSFLAALDDPQKFNRPHRIPTLAADDPGYDKNGGYWRGSVWAPTTYMVLRGLRAIGHRDLAYSIALNHFNSVTKVFRDTGTFFENYCPEKIEGRSRKNHVGWSGLPLLRCCSNTYSAYNQISVTTLSFGISA